jgi:amino acid transporter
MVLLKLFIIVVVIVTGAYYIDIDNWTPFMPNGFGGVMGGAAAVFFAYIGFDAVSTLAEESKNPMRDLPKGMMYSLMICTVVYVLLALVLTGMVSYNALGVSDPLAEVFKLKGVKWMLYFVSIAAVVAMTSVILVFQLGQPRIWMSMARDGLLPKRFAKIHPKYKTPGFSTIMTGAVVGIPIFFTDETFVLDFTSIGTLFAFVLVCGGVLLLPKAEKVEGVKQRFRLPHINGKWIVPAIVVAAFALLLNDNSTYTEELFQFNSTNLSAKLPMWIFLLLCLIMATMSFLRNLSLIPVLGVLSCCYLLTGMAPSNWLWFGVWLLIGLVVYLLYGFRKSKLAQHS